MLGVFVSGDPQRTRTEDLKRRIIKMTGAGAKERESAIVSLCGRIWARAMKEKMLKEIASSNEINPT